MGEIFMGNGNQSEYYYWMNDEQLCGILAFHQCNLSLRRMYELHTHESCT